MAGSSGSADLWQKRELISRGSIDDEERQHFLANHDDDVEAYVRDNLHETSFDFDALSVSTLSSESEDENSPTGFLLLGKKGKKGKQPQRNGPPRKCLTKKQWFWVGLAAFLLACTIAPIVSKWSRPSNGLRSKPESVSDFL